MWPRLCILLLATLCSGVSLGAEPGKCWSQYLQTADFQRISEFLTGRENTSGRVVLRSKEESRDGMYVVWHFPEVLSAPAGSTLRLDYVHSAAKSATTLRLPISTALAGREWMAGLTGSDWPDDDRKLLAWHVSLLDPAGRIIQEYKSYLWEMPRGN